MASKVAPSCLALLVEANRLFPGRSKASDGLRASAKHTKESPGSDHEPHDDPTDRDGTKWVCAVDITEDASVGLSVDDLFARVVARRDPRVRYLIHDKRMVSSYAAHGYAAWEWRPYTGKNGHHGHGHVSVHNTAAARGDTSPWFEPATPQEAHMLFPGTQTVPILGTGPDSTGRWPMLGWKPDGSVFGWNLGGRGLRIPTEAEKRVITADGANVINAHWRTDGEFGYYLVTDMADDHGGLNTFTF